jgi:hypothetical protein
MKFYLLFLASVVAALSANAFADKGGNGADWSWKHRGNIGSLAELIGPQTGLSIQILEWELSLDTLLNVEGLIKLPRIDLN